MASALVEDKGERLHVILSIHGLAPPSEVEWDRYLALCDDLRGRVQGDYSRTRGLSISAGGGPTASQRKKLVRFLDGQSPLVAVVTESTVGRGVVTALSWFNASIKAFAPHKLGDAEQHLKLASATSLLVRRELEAMAVSLPGAKAVIDHALAKPPLQ